MTDVRANLGAHRQQHPCDDCGATATRLGGRVKHERRCPQFRRASNAVKRGKRRELYVERKYGPTKVGQYNDAIDNVGSTFKWQSKTTTAEPPGWALSLGHAGLLAMRGRKWFTEPMEHMAGLRDDLAPLVIKSWTHQGKSSIDVIVVRVADWDAAHGLPFGPGAWADIDYLAMTGDYFLDVHGRDEA